MGKITYKTQLWKRIVFPILVKLGFTIIEVPNNKGYWEIVGMWRNK